MKKERSVPTLDDVAKAAGVSTATVSRCLNTPDRVVKETRKRVTEAVEALGYTPNFGARMMAAKRTHTIGAIIPTMENAIFARGLQAFQEELHRRGYTLIVASSAYQPELEKEQIRTLVARGADGILLIGHERDPDIYSYLETQNVPVLVAWTYSNEKSQVSVGFDNRSSMRVLVEEVIGQGHTQIGVISGERAGNDRVSQRLAGIQDALHLNGIPVDKLQIIETAYGIDEGAAAFDKLIAMTQPPTAIICGNDVLAVGAIHRAQAMGFRVPEDVSITGFDDIELAKLVSPALTTVHVPHHQMGLKAAITLADMVENKGTPASYEIETTLALRDSLGPPSQV